MQRRPSASLAHTVGSRRTPLHVPHVVLPTLFPDSLVKTLAEVDWLRETLKSSALTVASLVPGTFEAYCRVLHPFHQQRDDMAAPPRWRALAHDLNFTLDDTAALFDVRESLAMGYYVEAGSLSAEHTAVVIERLEPATSTPQECTFAVWDGYGNSRQARPTATELILPGRRYYAWPGSITEAAVTTSQSASIWRGANLWWPRDHAWCVASDVDFIWTYIGGSALLIDALLSDERIDSVRVLANISR